MAPIDFWFSIGSTYTYLTVMRIADVTQQAGVELHYRPFDVRAIMIEQKNIPFRDKPVKTAYMWRDMERRAAGYGLPIKVPAPYPLDNLPLANRIAIVGFDEGWGAAYLQETYRAWFQDGLPAGDLPNLERVLGGLGQNVDEVVARGESESIGKRLADQTEKAKALGVFGAPTFVVGDEVFWGDDRLTDAIDWAREGRLGRRT